MAAVRKGVWQLSGIRAFGASKPKVPSLFERPIFHPSRVLGIRHSSQGMKPHSSPWVKFSGRLVFFDTSPLVKRLEGEGLPSKQAHNIALFIINDLLKEEIQKSRRFSRLHHEIKKKLKNVIENISIGLRTPMGETKYIPMKLWILTLVLIPPLLIARGRE